jgi:hypothetical protein
MQRPGRTAGTSCFPGCAASLPAASTTAPVCMRPLPGSVTGLSRSSNAPLTRLAFNCCHGDGSSNEPSLGSSKPPPGKGFRGVDRERQSVGLHCLGAAAHRGRVKIGALAMRARDGNSKPAHRLCERGILAADSVQDKRLRALGTKECFLCSSGWTAIPTRRPVCALLGFHRSPRAHETLFLIARLPGRRKIYMILNLKPFHLEISGPCVGSFPRRWRNWKCKR